MSPQNQALKRVLMVALEVPPCHSAGVLRTLSFVRGLPGSGWQPVVLSASESVYAKIDREIDPAWPYGAEVHRAWAIDASRHLAVHGRYWSATAIPDKYVSWLVPALICGARLIRKHRPDAIWSTYPVATSHWVAAILSRRYGLPWIADYRDPAPFLYDPSEKPSSLAMRIDRRVAMNASILVFTTDKTQQLYLRHYPRLKAENTCVIENGFDDVLLAGLTDRATSHSSSGDIVLVHSGALYGAGREPDNLIRAVAIIARRLEAKGRRLRLRFRGADPTSAQLKLIADLDAAGYVEFCSRVPFREAFAEMFKAQALVLLQHELFQFQIPGKAYEYISSGRPILAITTRDGATAELLRRVGSTEVVNNEVDDICRALERVIEFEPREEQFDHHARSLGASRLSTVLSETLCRRNRESTPNRVIPEQRDA